MNCKSCEYPLWNLESRQCPECGLAFLPSQYEFALNSVRYCCPGCKQAYYGTSATGHLVPDEFDCVTCGRHLKMDEMVLLPTAGITENQTKSDTHPWMERARIGRLRAWFKSMGRTMGDPARTISIIPLERPGFEAFWYGFVTLAVFFLVNFSIFFVPSMIFSSLGLRGGLGALGYAGTVIFPIAGLLAALAAFLLIQSGIAHLVLGMTGGSDQPFRRSLQCVCFSSGTALLCAVPCLGFVFSPILGIWWFITSAIMLKTAHKVSAWRAGAAAGILPVVLTALLICAFWLGPSRTVKISSPVPNGPSSTISIGPHGLSSEVTKVAQALRAFHDQHGKYPVHGIQLGTQGDLLVTDLVGSGDPENVTVATISLANGANLSGEGLKAWGESAAALLPKDVIAHRAGDFVFTYHGIDPEADGAEALWIAVYCPSGSGADAEVIFANGGMKPMNLMDGTEVTRQNALRAEFHLPPLPPPCSIAESQPAVQAAGPQVPK